MNRSVVKKSVQIPVEFVSACKSLAECRTIDEAKYWDNKADALTAWAKIYHSEEAVLEAKRLKLHAYRRMGQLSEELRPGDRIRHSDRPRRPFSGQVPGGHSLLTEHGIPSAAATAAVYIGRLSQAEFEKNELSARPLSPTTLYRASRGDSPDLSRIRMCASSLRTACRAIDAREVAAMIHGDLQRKSMKDLVLELIEWLDRFEQHLAMKSVQNPAHGEKRESLSD